MDRMHASCNSYAFLSRSRRVVPRGSLSNHDYDGNKERHKFAYLTMKDNSIARFARAVFIFDISQTFSFFLRREMTCFAVVWLT